MSATSVLLNLLWILFGGLWMALGWMIAAVIMAITIIGSFTSAATQPRRTPSALAIREKVLGPKHPDTATSLNELAYLLHAQGDRS